MAISEFYADVVLDRVFGGGATSIKNTSHYVALSTTAPNFDGTNFSEPSGGGYGREVHTAATLWSAPGGPTITSQVQVDFLASGAAWGTVSHMGVYDALTLGNLLWFLTLDQPEILQDGDDSAFPIGDLQLTMPTTPLTDFIVGEVMDTVAGSIDYAPDAQMQVGLATTAPTVGGSFTEPVGGSYGRVTFDNDGTSWSGSSAGQKTHAAAFNFPDATGSWGTVTHWGLFDGVGDTLVAFGALTTPQAVGSGDRVRFGPGAITIAIT